MDNEEEDEGDDDDEDYGSRKKQRKSKSHKSHKKRKKDYKIDEDDADMIKENTGMSVKTKQRLKRNADVSNPEGGAAASSLAASALKEDHHHQGAAGAKLMDSRKGGVSPRTGERQHRNKDMRTIIDHEYENWKM